MIHILNIIIRPNSFDVFSKLISDKMEKLTKYLKDLKFAFHNICPCDTSTIINISNKLSCTRNKF